MYKCDHCPYKTSVKCNFFRHLNRKRKCYNTKLNINADVPDINADVPDINADVPDINADVPDINATTINKDVSFICMGCKRSFSRRSKLECHKQFCRGRLNILQCETCFKIFNSYQGKYQHKKNVICYPPPQSAEPNDLCEIKQCSTINNHGTITNNTNCSTNNNTINNNTYNITLNPFGSEDLWKIMQDKDVSEKIKWNLLNDDKYTIARAVPDVFFNDKYPENKTIKKLVKNDGMVEVHTGNNQWETRLTKDTVSTIGKKINSILEYVVQNSSFSEKDRRKLSKFGEYSSYFEFLDVIGDIEDKVGKEYNDPPENEKRRFQRELGKLIADIIYKESVKII